MATNNRVSGVSAPPDRFRKKPVVIEAFRWQGDFDALDAWLNTLGYSEDGDDGLPNGPAGIHEDHNPAGDLLLVIPTLEGEMTALTGDWIIRGIKGEFCPCKPDIFDATYERMAPGAAVVSRETERWHTSTASLVECPFIDQKGQIDGQEKEAEGRDVRPPTSVRAIVGEIPADWIPTADVINALPEPIRWYIHQLETHDVDPAGDIRALWQAREQVQQLAAKLKEAEPAAGSPLALPDIEIVASAVHEAWMEQKRAKGITSAPSQQTGEEQLRPYAELSSEVQEYDRATVRAVYAAIARLGAGRHE